MTVQNQLKHRAIVMSIAPPLSIKVTIYLDSDKRHHGGIRENTKFQLPTMNRQLELLQGYMVNIKSLSCLSISFNKTLCHLTHSVFYLKFEYLHLINAGQRQADSYTVVVSLNVPVKKRKENSGASMTFLDIVSAIWVKH